MFQFIYWKACRYRLTWAPNKQRRLNCSISIKQVMMKVSMQFRRSRQLRSHQIWITECRQLNNNHQFRKNFIENQNDFLCLVFSILHLLLSICVDSIYFQFHLSMLGQFSYSKFHDLWLDIFTMNVIFQFDGVDLVCGKNTDFRNEISLCNSQNNQISL